MSTDPVSTDPVGTDPVSPDPLETGPDGTDPLLVEQADPVARDLGSVLRPTTGLADQLAATALGVSGIAALEPGVSTTLQTLDARIRCTAAVARYGLHLDPVEGRLLVEVAVRSLHPVRSVVEDLQSALTEALRAGGLADVDVVVRVQSVA
ncbi:hypothetical protein ACT3TZ_04005 [Brachybacterium sp. AOP25-B2-12]|uniref:hypothetical protein n=1 Tax=Brachybacterium sp. AOP25-B2-12 TaxID=3457710 RepID=UPI004033DACB